MHCVDCPKDAAVDGRCPAHYVAFIEARDAGKPKAGDFGYEPKNDIDRAMHKAARRKVQNFGYSGF